MEQLKEKTRKWIEARPFLDEIGKFHEAIQNTCLPFTNDSVDLPNWDIFLDEFKNGTPILAHSTFQLPLQKQAGKIFQALANLADNDALPVSLQEKCKDIQKVSKQYPDFGEELVGHTLYQSQMCAAFDTELAALDEGVIKLFVWLAISYALKPYLPSLAEWQEQQKWEEAICPTCGGTPNMAVLKRGQKGRQKYLVCHCCQTKWQYKRIGCPYCGCNDQQKLGILEIEEEPNMRLDICNECNHYIKTYMGRGEEEVALVDWLSIHLDILCKQKGYAKKATLISE